MLTTMYKITDHATSSHQTKKTRVDADWNYYKAEDEVFVKVHERCELLIVKRKAASHLLMEWRLKKQINRL